MSMQRYSPIEEFMAWSGLNRLMNENSLFHPRSVGDMMGHMARPLDLYETANGYTIHYPIAGANPESIEVTVQNTTISVTWETGTKPPADARQLHSGIQHGTFQEAFTMPAELDAQSLGACYEHGILYIHVAKAAHGSSRTIRVGQGQNQPQSKSPNFTGN